VASSKGVVGAAFCSDILLKDLDDDIEAESLSGRNTNACAPSDGAQRLNRLSPKPLISKGGKK
jgi:hypothetical protein